MKINHKGNISDIAIIGMACRFPGANNYTEYWENLVAGKNCVGEIPKERWCWQDYYGDSSTEEDKTKIKSGGFIDDIDKFDPLFFNISPREADYMDPQHRIFLESAWHAIEDAGYNPKVLAGKEIGVYAGVSKNDYAELMREYKVPIISFLSTGTVHSILANRVSYLLDFTGKSEVVDTACSSFLVALDKAINDISAEYCEAAVVGGVNAILSPTMYISHSKSGMLSVDGSCKSFDENANGYVRSEGVGVIFVKALNKALSDNDNILGVVKGSAVKHGGRSNFLTAPKVSSQAATISAAIAAANIDPKTIGYLEAHGTGTPLGDPIEINALKQAYQSFMTGGAQGFCGLTSAKTNVGHLESAAGVAGLIKVLLSFKYQLIPSLLHFKQLNPYINLKDSPFYIVNKNQNWEPIKLDGKEYPLRAGISSFGMGGVNAHVILEAPPRVDRNSNAVSINKSVVDKRYLLPFSAKTTEQLFKYVLLIYESISKAEVPYSIEDICFTLQTGREALERRVVFLADNYDHLIVSMKDFIDNKKNDSVLVGAVQKGDKNKNSNLLTGSNRSLVDVTKHWLSGGNVIWKEYTNYPSGNRIQLPGYPFDRRRCWFPRKEAKHVLDSNAQKSGEVVWQKISTSDYFVHDHVVKGEYLVPGVKCLDILRNIGEQLTQSPVHKMEDIYWVRAIKIKKDINMRVAFTKMQDAKHQNSVNPVRRYDSNHYRTDTYYNLSLVNENSTYCTGVVTATTSIQSLRRLDLEKIKIRCRSTITHEDLYDQFRYNGLEYGATFQVIKACSYNQKEIVCELVRSPVIDKSNNGLEPSMLDGVFQSVVALQVLNVEQKQKQQVPFYLKTLKVYKKIPDRCYAYSAIDTKTTLEDGVSYNMYLCDQQGEIVVEFTEFVKREYIISDSQSNKSDSTENELLYYAPQWVNRALGMHSENLSSIIVFDTDVKLISQLRKKRQNQHVILVKIGDKFKQIGKYTYSINAKKNESFKLLWDDLKKQGIKIEAVIYKWNFKNTSSVPRNINLGIELLLMLTQSLILEKLSNRVRILYLYPIQSALSSCIHASVGGFSRTLSYENPNINITSVGLKEVSPAKFSQAVLQELSFYRNAPLNEVQYINGQRKVRMVTRLNKFNPPTSESLIKQNGTYLIAGGAGGLGYIFASYLAKNYAARLVLLGRADKNKKIENQLNQLHSLGGEALYYSAEIDNETSLQQVCKAIRARGIQLNGVLNCAGLIEDAYIINKARESLSKVIAPKIYGTLNIDKVTKDEPLDFFILFSSIASIMPNQGQCDYAAANSFLDEFSAYRNYLTKQQKRNGVAIAVNWPLWRDGGIGVIKEEQEYLWNVFGMKPLESERGLHIFDRIVNKKMDALPNQLIAIEGEQYKIEKHLNVMSREFDLEKNNSTSELTVKSQIRAVISSVTSTPRDITDEESLVDYGVDSVGISKITTLINKAFSVEVDPTLFFDFNTVSKIAKYLLSKYSDLSLENNKMRKSRPLYTPEQALIDLDISDRASLTFHKLFSDEEFFMKDHVVEGLYNVPGACYIEMALQASRLLLQDGKAVKLSNNYWAKQLSTSGKAIQADLLFTQKGEYYEYEISHSKRNERVIHALGQVHCITLERSDSHYSMTHDIDAIKTRCNVIRKTEEIYQFIHAEGLHVGPSFQPMLQIYLNEKEALSHLKLPVFISNTFDDYVLHPSMLTGVLQTALLNNKPDGITSSKFIPIAIDEIVVFDKIPVECYVYTEIVSANRTNNDIKKFTAKVITINGEVVVEIKGLSLRNITPTIVPLGSQRTTLAPSSNAVAVSSHITEDQITLEQVCQLLKEILSDSIGVPPSEIDAETQLESYGINSVMIVDLNRRLEEIFGNLSKTLFFEYKRIVELAEYFISNHFSALKKQVGEVDANSVSIEREEQSNATSDYVQQHIADDEEIFVKPSANTEILNAGSLDVNKEPVAIVGMSGRYPDAKNLYEFWENLKSGKDSIRKIPESRFDRRTLKQLYPEQVLLPEEWGGFIDDVDKFDPSFFNISPREAALIDPQERLFLEVTWETIEDAGYSAKKLNGQSIGVFVGALWQPYITLGVEQTFNGNMQRPHGLLYSIANRVSFFFDWCGPSLAVDTACSASLSALHLACESVKRGESQSAVVGGVNISLSTSKYLWLSNNNFLSSDGKCRSFGSGGDGYVPGEGVGAVFIKRLRDAVKDSDHIYGVIKGTSINHGGKTNGYTVPNPVKQTELILSTLNKSGVSAEEISYIEAHGTGTSLGDPIEISGLQKVFSNYTNKKEFCAIGSVKSNIGHLEAAAGIAGLTKLLLQMKHKTLVPSIHSDELNPNIDFPSTSFVLQRKLAVWEVDAQNEESGQGMEIPRRAMLSSFGAGGSNAHAIIEEHLSLDAANNKITNTLNGVAQSSLSQGIIIPLSAKTRGRLKMSAKNLLNYVVANETSIVDIGGIRTDYSVCLEDIAFTLQVGRQAMDERVIFLTHGITELKDSLKKYIEEANYESSNVISGNTEAARKAFKIFTTDAKLNKVLDEWVSSGDGLKVANLWVNGVEVDWNLLYPSTKPKKVSLPTYPFNKDRYWITESNSVAIPGRLNPHQIAHIHPLLHENTSDLYAQRFSTTFTGKESYFEDTGQAGVRVLPWMVYLEMANAAVCEASALNDRKQNIVSLSHIEWLKEFSNSDVDTKLHIALTLDESSEENDSQKYDEKIYFEIYSINPEQKNKTTTYAQGLACIEEIEYNGNIDVPDLRGKIGKIDLELSKQLSSSDKGKVEAMKFDDGQLLLKYESTKLHTSSRNGFTLHPNALSLALAACESVVKSRPKLNAVDSDKLMQKLSAIRSFLPTTLDKLVIGAEFSNNMYARIKCSDILASSANASVRSNVDSVALDVDFINNNGFVCAQAIGLRFECINISKNEQELRLPENPHNVKPNDALLSEKPRSIVLSSLNVANNAPIQHAEPESKRYMEEKYLPPVDDDKNEELIEHIVQVSVFEGQSTPSNNELIQVLKQSLANALYMQCSDVVEDKPFTEMGLDSIVGVEWIKEVNKSLSLNVNATIVYDFPTIRELANYLALEISKETIGNHSEGRITSEPSVKGIETSLGTNNLVDKTHLNQKQTSQPPVTRNNVNIRMESAPREDSQADSNNVSLLPVSELQKALVSSLSKALYMEEHDVNIESSFTDMGLDSIVGVEWVKAINQQFGTAITATAVYDYSNVREFSRYLEEVMKSKCGENEQALAVAE